MSIAKKSIKWLVALFVIFALVLTAVFAVGNVARASAEPEQPVADSSAASAVVIEVTDSVGNVYPDLANVANETRTLTVNYYVEIPAAAQANGYSEMKFSPVLVYPSGREAKPNTVTLNNALSAYAEIGLSANYVAGTELEETNAFNVYIKDGATIGQVNGATSDGNDGYTLSNYLFQATYVLTYESNEDVVGAYEFILADDPTDEDDGSEITPSDEGVKYIPEITEGEFTISAIVEYPTITTTSFVYNGSEQAVYSGSNAGYTYTGAAGTTVDDYTAVFTLNDYYIWADENAEGGYTRANHSVDWEITKMQIAIPEEDDTDFVFTGSAQSYNVAASDYYTVTGTPQTAAGEYVVTISLNDTANTEWKDAEEGKEIADIVYDFVIAKMQIAIPEEDDTEFVYTGSAQNYTVAESDYYTVDGTPQTNAGEYEVTISLDDTDNTEWSDGTTEDIVYDFVIAKVQITKPTPYGNNQYVYDSYNKQFMLDVVSAETGYYTISNNIRRNAGSQTVTVSLKDKTNTEWADGTTADLEFTLTVQPRPVNLSVSADAASHVYGDTPANVSISATGIIDAFTCSYKVVCVDGEAPYAEYTPTQFNAGLNVGHYTLNPVYNDINGNYDVTVSEPFSYEITKKQVSIPKAVSGLTFNGSEQEGVVNDDNSSLYDLGDWDMDDFNLASGSAKGTAAGNYTATFALEDTDNTEWANAEAGEEITNKTIAWYIDYVLVTKPTATTTTYYYSGSEQTYAFASVGDSDKYTVANNKRTNAGTQTVTATLSNENYKWADGTTANLEFTFTIKKASVMAAPCSLDNTFTYTGEEITCNFVSEGQQSYFTITGHKQTNVGIYDVTETLNDPNNYKWSHFPNVSDDEPTAPYVQENAFEITKKAVAIPTAISGLEYTGSAQVGVTKTDGSFYTLYSGSDEETAVGNYTATYSLKSTTNCYWAGDTTDVANKTVEWSIAKKSITKPSISASFKIYNGTSQSYSGSGTGYTFTGSGTNAGEYPVTVTLTDKDNSVWAGTDSADDYEVADKLVINKKTVKLTLAETADSSVYGNSIATITAGINPDYAPINTADIGTLAYTAKNFQTNVVYTKAQFETVGTAPVGNYILTAVCSIDNPNYDVDAQTLPYEITKRPIEIPVLNQDDPSFVYNGSAQGISFFSGSLDDAAYFTLSGTNSATNVGNYTYTATLNDATNCEWEDETTAAKNYDWSITTRYITVPTVVDDTFDYDGNDHSIGFSNVDNDYVDITYDTQSAIGVYTDTTTVALKAAHAGNIAWDEAGYPTAAKTYTLTIEMVEVNFTIVPIFNNTQKTGTAATQNVLSALPAATNYRWFKFAGYTFDDEAVTTVSLDMEGETVYANYTYAVGAGDVNGDGVVSTLDVIQMRKWNVGLDRTKKIATAAAAWTKTDDTSVTSAVLYTAMDANGSGAFNGSDIVATREALATGYNYKIIIEQGIVRVKKTNRVEVDNYADLVANIEIGNAVTLTTNIEAANEVFNEDLAIPVDIYLGTYRLTVKGFTLNTNTAGATLRIAGDAEEGGIIYTVTGITVTAPNGNVVVANVNGYSYDGTVVNLAAYSESLHIEDSVAFYIYKAQDPVTNEDYANVDAFIADVYPEEETVETIAEVVATIQTLATTRIGETEARMADIATIKADTERTEAQKAEDINALDVKKAILEVPIDTHVVVEESAKLSAEKIVVKAQSDTTAPAVTTFAIEVKNAEAEVVTVDISEVKEGTGADVVYVVDEVAISGNTSKVEVVAGENTDAEVKKYVAQIGSTGYESLQAAIDAAVNGDTVKLLASVANGTGIKTADDNKQGTKVGKTFTIDFNGFTYTVDGAGVGSSGTETQAMHWGAKDTITLKNGTITISEKAVTIPNPANNKLVKMAMQNYADLTVKNMTMDFSEIVVRNYGTYTGDDAPYSGLEIPLFNLNAGSMTIENTTITFPNDSTKGILIEIPDAATIKNSTINGYVSLGKFTANVTIINTTTSGVVSYFAGYGVKQSGNVYRLGGVSVTNATELQAALDAGAIIIDIENDFNAPNPIAVTKSTIINGYDHTITSAGNRIMNVTEAGVVLTINDLTMTSATSERGLNIWDSATDTDITLNNVTIDAHLYAINYVNGADNETLTINNSSITGWAAINAHCNNSTFTVTDSTLYGINRNCDSQYGFSTVVIDGSSLFGSEEGEHGVDNTFVFDGCTIIAEVTLTHQYWISFQYAATGNVASVVVNNCEILDAPNGNDKSADMKIDGNNNAVVMALSAEQYAIVAAKHFNITDNGNGTYTIMPKTANISYFGTPYNFYDVFENGWLEDTEAFTLTDDVTLDTDVVFAANRAAAIAVSGGTFEMNLDGNTISGVGKILLPVGVTCVTDSTVSIASVFEAPEGEVLIESVDADGNYIYAVGKAYVKTEAEFTAAIEAGATYIALNGNIALATGNYIVIDSALTLDLNGYTISADLGSAANSKGVFNLTTGANLTVIDTSASGTGVITATGDRAAYGINVYSGANATLTVNGGYIFGKSAGIYTNTNAGTVTINAGYIKSTGSQGFNLGWGETYLVMNGGTIESESTYAIWTGSGAPANDPSTVTINGGKIITPKTEGAICVGAGNVVINGGDFTETNRIFHNRATSAGHNFTFVINGGTFAKMTYTNRVNYVDSEVAVDAYLAEGKTATETENGYTVVELELTITTFAELKAAIAAVNAGTYNYPTLIIANDIAFEEELTISKSVYIKGDGEVKFIGYDASTKYDEAFYINVADEDQEITIDGIVFDHFCYYSNVANKTKATASAVKNGVAYITYGGDCPASTTLYITGCQFLGTARDMINVSSTKGCKGYIVIEDCVFDATDRLSNTLNMLSFYGNEDAELSVLISGCTFKEATEQNATWATSAIASFGNADITVTGCEFIACQIAIAIDNTFDRLFSTSTYPVYHNTTVTLVDNTYTNCYFGYYEESVVASVDDIPEGAELNTDEPFTYGDYEATQFHFAAEYDVTESGTEGVDAKYLTVICYYVEAMPIVASGDSVEDTEEEM